MKKLFLSLSALAVLSVSASAITIDDSTAVAHFTGFKMAKKLGVKGVIKDAKFDFKTKDGSVVQILNDVSATMDFKNEFTKDKTREKNIHKTYIANLDNSEIKASLKNVKGDDVKGSATAVITFNNVTKEIPMTYSVDGGKLTVKGEINMKSDFKTEKAYEALSTDKKIAALHGKKTWEEVEIYFDVDVK